MPDTGILCMAYGSPAGEPAVAAYFTHIRGGRPPSAEALEDLLGRYRAIGGSPLERITRAQASALSAEVGLPVLVGMKHSAPFIDEAARAAARAGVARLVGLPLAPHYSGMSVGGYERALRQAWTGELVFVPGFHDHPAFISAVRSLLAESLAGFRPEHVFFTAHSLPRRILDAADPYQEQLLRSCRLVAGALDIPRWSLAYQSASQTGEPWLGPDLVEALESTGVGSALVCPIGFVADHLEILYDIDVEAQDFCRERGVELRRTASFNDRPEFIEALAAVVRDALAASATASAART